MRRPVAFSAALVLVGALAFRPAVRAQQAPYAPVEQPCAAATDCLACAAGPSCGWCADEGACANAGPGAAPCTRFITASTVCKAPLDPSEARPVAPPPQTPPQPAPETPTPTPGASLEPQARTAVQSHAAVRATLGIAPLAWSAELASVASDWAQQLCAGSRGGRAVLRHRPDNRYGENIYWMGGAPTPPGVDEAVRSWADERRFYDAASGQCSGGQCGHYTQLVWRNTRSVGCGSATCAVGTFWVCNYDPPGNYVGQRPY